jgi:hypothetical protein
VANAGVDYGLVWRQTLGTLDVLGLSSTQRAFVRLCRLVGVLDQTALVRVPNDYTKDFLETRVRDQVTQALAEHLGHPVQLAVSVDESLESEQAAAQAEFDETALGLPNTLHDSVPDGRDESANVEVRRWGTPREFDFTPLDHVAIGEKLALVDFEAAGRISGARFVVLKGGVARRACLVSSDLRRLATLLECPELLDVQHEATSRQIARDGFRVGAEQLGVEHGRNRPGRENCEL